MLNKTRGIIAIYLGVWRYLPDAGTFSVREWVQDATRTGWLPLQSNVTQCAYITLHTCVAHKKHKKCYNLKIKFQKITWPIFSLRRK